MGVEAIGPVRWSDRLDRALWDRGRSAASVPVLHDLSGSGKKIDRNTHAA
jgi:hypothetical protein